MQTMGVPINDEANLEREADIIGAKANQLHNSQSSVIGSPISAATAAKNFNGISQPKIQRFLKTPKTNKPPIVVIQRVATVDLVDAGNDRGYLIGVGWPDVNAHLTAYGMYLTNMLAAFAANTGAANPPAGSPLDLAAAGIRRFTQRIIESLDGFDGELREVDRLSNKGRAAVPAGGGPIPGAIPILGYPAIGPDIMYLKPGGYTGMEVKSPNTDAVGAVNTDILDADGQLGGFLLNRQKIMINIMHQDNPWPGMVGGHGTFFTRLNDLALEGAIDAQLNGMAILNADMITILNVNTNYAPNQEDVVATWNGAAWVSNVL
jgi:hypothetical protein